MLREISCLIMRNVPGIKVKMFNSVLVKSATRKNIESKESTAQVKYVPMTPLISDSNLGNEIILVGRNFDIWKQIIDPR